MDALMAANQLVAAEFYPPKLSPLADALSYNAYRLRHAAQNLGLHLNEGAKSRHVTLLAVPDGAARGPRSRGRGARDARRQRRQELGWGGGGGAAPPAAAGGGRADECDAVGVCNVTLRHAGDVVSAAAGCRVGTPFAMVTNMTVAPGWRRRGVARRLMSDAVDAAGGRLAGGPHFMALLCYKGYSPAYSLYASFGFAPTAWMDPEWVEDAERGRVGKPRRLLMIKPLRPGMALLAPPPKQRPLGQREPAGAGAGAAAGGGGADAGGGAEAEAAAAGAAAAAAPARRGWAGGRAAG
ncbi:MAG: hypothetical protein J3K34DRAFT_490482 [Monoraphidium minutum]|nr:MAG: hypothetical protein J3K34DRAFT_490482 [Monoraphidium minutum]